MRLYRTFSCSIPHVISLVTGFTVVMLDRLAGTSPPAAMLPTLEPHSVVITMARPTRALPLPWAPKPSEQHELRMLVRDHTSPKEA